MVRLALLVAALFSAAAFADEVRLRDGETITGEWAAPRIEVDSDHGEIIVPGHHLELVRRDGERFVLTLTDGSSVAGIPRLEAVELRTGLVLRRIPLTEIEEIRVETSPEELVASTAAAGGYIEADRIEQNGQVVATPCPLRVRLKLPQRFKEGDWYSTRTRAVECDNAVSVSRIEVTFRQSRNGSGSLVIRPHVLVKPPQDKLADAALTLVLDGEPIGSAHRQDLDIEEGKTTRTRFTFTVPEEVVSRWSSGADVFLDLELSAVIDH